MNVDQCKALGLVPYAVYKDKVEAFKVREHSPDIYADVTLLRVLDDMVELQDLVRKLICSTQEYLHPGARRDNDWYAGTVLALIDTHPAAVKLSGQAPPLCEDEGCPNAGTPHVCVTKPRVAVDDITQRSIDTAPLLQPGDKPYFGRITDWRKAPAVSGNGLGYVIEGRFLDHPLIKGLGHTSWVVKHDMNTGEIETRNSRYTLVGEELL